MSIWVCTRPHYFYCPSPDFTTSIVSQSVTNNHYAHSCGGTREKWRGTSKNFRPALRAGILPPLGDCFRRHWSLGIVLKAGCPSRNGCQPTTSKHWSIDCNFGECQVLSMQKTLCDYAVSSCTYSYMTDLNVREFCFSASRRNYYFINDINNVVIDDVNKWW